MAELDSGEVVEMDVETSDETEAEVVVSEAVVLASVELVELVEVAEVKEREDDIVTYGLLSKTRTSTFANRDLFPTVPFS